MKVRCRLPTNYQKGLILLLYSLTSPEQLPTCILRRLMFPVNEWIEFFINLEITYMTWVDGLPEFVQRFECFTDHHIYGGQMEELSLEF